MDQVSEQSGYEQSHHPVHMLVWRVGRLRCGECRDHTMEVFENVQYFAANSAIWNPSVPRGARFPAHPPKWDSNKSEQQRWA